MKRLLYWLLGFVALFLFNVLVEAVLLPWWGLDNTPRNDIYFQLWWVAVILWLIFGRMVIRRWVPTTEHLTQ